MLKQQIHNKKQTLNNVGKIKKLWRMEPLFCIRQLVEKYRENNRKLCL